MTTRVIKPNFEQIREQQQKQRERNKEIDRKIEIVKQLREIELQQRKHPRTKSYIQNLIKGEVEEDLKWLYE